VILLPWRYRHSGNRKATCDWLPPADDVGQADERWRHPRGAEDGISSFRRAPGGQQGAKPSAASRGPEPPSIARRGGRWSGATITPAGWMLLRSPPLLASDELRPARRRRA